MAKQQCEHEILSDEIVYPKLQYQRPLVSQRNCLTALHETAAKFHARRKEKGMGALVSPHEILGHIHEELYEVTQAIHDDTSVDELIEELKDVAVAAMFGIASIQAIKGV